VLQYFYERRLWVYGGLALLLLLDAGLYLGWIRDASAEPEAARARVAELQREVTDSAAEVQRLTVASREAPHLGPKLKRFLEERILPERAGYSSVAADLADVAGETGVQLGNVSYKAKDEKLQSELVRIEITTGVEGSYASILRFLQAMERSPRFYLINDLTVDSARSGAIQLRVQLATYFRRSAA